MVLDFFTCLLPERYELFYHHIYDNMMLFIPLYKHKLVDLTLQFILQEFCFSDSFLIHHNFFLYTKENIIAINN